MFDKDAFQFVVDVVVYIGELEVGCIRSWPLRVLVSLSGDLVDEVRGVSVAPEGVFEFPCGCRFVILA